MALTLDEAISIIKAEITRTDDGMTLAEALRFAADVADDEAAL